MKALESLAAKIESASIKEAVLEELTTYLDCFDFDNYYSTNNTTKTWASFYSKKGTCLEFKVNVNVYTKSIQIQIYISGGSADSPIVKHLKRELPHLFHVNSICTMAGLNQFKTDFNKLIEMMVS